MGSFGVHWWVHKKLLEAVMLSTDYAQFAEALVFVHGRKAEAEAAMHAALCEKTGDMETAETWRRVQSAVRVTTQKKAA
jgi:hypothetical protein